MCRNKETNLSRNLPRNWILSPRLENTRTLEWRSDSFPYGPKLAPKPLCLAATQSRRILARLQAGLWDLLELLDLGPLETDPLIQLVVEYLGDKLTASPGVALEPRRNLDRNILALKLQHRGEE